MAITQNVSLTAPTDYTSEAQAIERRRKLAEALQAQGMQQQPTEVVNGWAVPQGYGAPLAKLAQSLSGAYGQYKSNEQEKALASKYQSDLINTVMAAEKARLGTAAQTIPPDPQEIAQAADQGTPAVAPVNVPAVAPNTQLANALLMQHPATQGMGLQGIQRDMQIQQLMQMAGQGAPSNPMAPGPGASVMAGAPGTTPAAVPAGNGFGGAAGGIPMAAWLQVDPSGKAYLEQLAKDAAAKKTLTRVAPGGYAVNQEGQAMFSAPTNEGRLTTFGPNGPVQSLVPGATATTTALSSVPLPNAEMRTVKLSNQRELQLTQPEYLAYTQSGGKVLPERYSALARELPGMRFGEQSEPKQEPPKRAGGKSTGGQQSTPGLPAQTAVVGATQSGPEQVEQARQTAAGKAVDEQFGKDYVAFTTGGSADAAKQLSQLNDVTKALQNPKANLTGPVIGSVPDVAKKFTETGRNAIAMRERVEEVVQRSLRAILGAQFTEKEGERLIARAYNPNLSEAENAIRVQRLFTQLQSAYQAKADAAKYFERNGTLQGWQGRLPTMSDFDPETRTSTGKVGGSLNWNSLP